MSQFSQNEMVTLFLGLGGLSFILLYRNRLRSAIPHMRLLVLSFLFQLAGWFFTVAETVLWPDLLNGLEHTSRFISLLFLLRWIALLSRPENQTQ